MDTTSNDYTIIVPSIDNTGPVNVALDLAREAARRQWRVRILSLSIHRGPPGAIDFEAEVRQFRLSDLWSLKGIVHTHCLRPDILGLILSVNPHIKLFSTVHNLFLIDLAFEYSPLKVRLAWLLWKTALRRFSAVVCISAAMQRYYKNKLPDVNCVTIRNARNPKHGTSTVPRDFTQWLDRQRSAGKLILGFVGTLTVRKNVASLVRAVADDGRLALVVCGSGPLESEIHETAKSSKAQDRIYIAGQLPTPMQHVASIDALVLPSFAEGLPLVVVEAASYGVPSLLSNIAVHRELCRLGFGATFNHHTFGNLFEKASELHRKYRSPSQQLTDLWLTSFTPATAFGQYESLFHADV